MPNTSRIPKPCRHKATGQAVVRLNGKDHYLGPWKSPAAKACYERLIGQWLASGRQLPSSQSGLTVNELILAYDNFATGHYRKPDGIPTRQLELIHLAMRPLKELYGRTSAADFGPLDLKAVRQKLLEKNTLCRTTINEHVAKIKRLFRWGVENELVPPSVFHGLHAVSGLRLGRSTARESKPVRPVAEAFIEAAKPHIPPPVRAMVELQLLTAMRPGEACAMRSIDLDMSGRVWIFRPESHKTEHHGHVRQIYLGPRAQEVVRPWLKLDLTSYLFSPREAEAARNDLRCRERKTPMTPSQAKRRPKKHPKRPKGDHYDVAAYRRAIRRACAAADKKAHEADPEIPADQVVVPGWHPHQLRHNAATNLRKEFGVELARIVLGHATAFTTEIYAEADKQQAMQVIARIG
jgi:integrase